jgi:cyclic beta-1,2-glucan synthetase
VQYETDRGRFLGRGHTAADPIAVMEDRPLSNTVGAVLDPVFSLRRRVRIPPGETVRVRSARRGAFARRSDDAGGQVSRPNIFERELRLAWTKAQVEMSHLNIDAEEAHLFQRLAARIIYSDPRCVRARTCWRSTPKRNRALWATASAAICRSSWCASARRTCHGAQTRARHEYLHYKGLKIDLVILNDNPTTTCSRCRRNWRR